MLSFISKPNLAKVKICFDLNQEKHNRYLQNSNIKITKASKENLKDIECILFTNSLHEKYIFKNEIVEFIKKGFLPKLKAVILTAKEIKLLSINKILKEL